MHAFRSIAFVANQDKPDAPALAEELSAVARKAGIRTSITHAFPLPDGFLRGYDACCAIGGDGTLLGVVTEAVRENTPVLGINRGSLGFLTTLSAEEARSCFATLIAGDCEIVERSLLQCSTGAAAPHIALNDILIKDAVSSRLVSLEVLADGEFVTDYLCDGLIFSTPTGSTAYNLSAGGPLIHPRAQVFAMTPICPHTLSNRSIIFEQGMEIHVRSRRDPAHLAIAIDGRRLPDICSQEETVKIQTSLARLRLIQKPTHSHFSVMRTKLKWSGGAASDCRQQ